MTTNIVAEQLTHLAKKNIELIEAVKYWSARADIFQDYADIGVIIDFCPFCQADLETEDGDTKDHLTGGNMCPMKKEYHFFYNWFIYHL